MYTYVENYPEDPTVAKHLRGVRYGGYPKAGQVTEVFPGFTWRSLTTHSSAKTR